jgi:CubicO group peptidase (beta-lactamase class C family)
LVISLVHSLATDVLGAVIEKVTGASLEAFVTERIAKPLRIQSFVFNVPEAIRSRFVRVTRPAQVTGALGTGYVPVAGPEAVPFPLTKGTADLDPNRAFSPTAYNSGGAGMSGTSGDYARFLQMLLNEGELDGVRVLRAETVRQMTQNATGNMPTLRGPGWGFTLGFGILTDPAAAKSRLPAGSYGWSGIYGTQFWIDPAIRAARGEDSTSSNRIPSCIRPFYRCFGHAVHSCRVHISSKSLTRFWPVDSHRTK